MCALITGTAAALSRPPTPPPLCLSAPQAQITSPCLLFLPNANFPARPLTHMQAFPEASLHDRVRTYAYLHLCLHARPCTQISRAIAQRPCTHARPPAQVSWQVAMTERHVAMTRSGRCCSALRRDKLRSASLAS